MLKRLQILFAIVNLSPAKEQLYLAWLKCWTLQSIQTLKALEFDVRFFFYQEGSHRWLRTEDKVIYSATENSVTHSASFRAPFATT